MSNNQAYAIGDCNSIFYFLVCKTMDLEYEVIALHRRKAYMLYYDMFIDSITADCNQNHYHEYLLWRYELS